MSASPKCAPEITVRKNAVQKSFRPIRAVQKKGPVNPEYVAEIRFQTHFVIMVRKNSLRVINHGEETTFWLWKILIWLPVLYVDPQNLMTNRRNLPFKERVSVPREN